MAYCERGRGEPVHTSITTRCYLRHTRNHLLSSVPLDHHSCAAYCTTCRAAFGGVKWSQKWASCEGDEFSYYKSVLKSKKPAKTFRLSHCTLHSTNTGSSSSRPNNTFEVNRIYSSNFIFRPLLFFFTSLPSVVSPSIATSVRGPSRELLS